MHPLNLKGGAFVLKLGLVFNKKCRRVSKDVFKLRDLLKILILYAENHTQQEKAKPEPSDALAGTYEEMYSNWRNKVEEHFFLLHLANKCLTFPESML